jgi:hypothetical protein
VDAAAADVKDDEYKEFYRHIAHDFAEPLAWSHNKAEGKREYAALLYVPGARPSICSSASANTWREALRAARVHHGRRRAVPAAVPALPARRRRFGTTCR